VPVVSATIVRLPMVPAPATVTAPLGEPADNVVSVPAVTLPPTLPPPLSVVTTPVVVSADEVPAPSSMAVIEPVPVMSPTIVRLRIGRASGRDRGQLREPADRVVIVPAVTAPPALSPKLSVGSATAGLR